MGRGAAGALGPPAARRAQRAGGERTRALDTFYPAFGAAVRGEGPVPVDPRDAVAGLEVIDAIRASAAQRRVVEL